MPGQVRGWEGQTARYNPYDLQQDKFIAVAYPDQIAPGSFEYALTEIVEQHKDLTVFERRYRNDQAGRLAYGPQVLLKIASPLGRVLYGRRIATVAPVFANIQNKGMRCFRLRGKGKVTTQ